MFESGLLIVKLMNFVVCKCDFGVLGEFVYRWYKLRNDKLIRLVLRISCGCELGLGDVCISIMVMVVVISGSMIIVDLMNVCNKVLIYVLSGWVVLNYEFVVIIMVRLSSISVILLW